jgi:hypothetical protein
MLRLTPPKTREALAKAAEAKERAQTAQGFEDRSFWEEMEAKWLHLAESYAFVDRANDFGDSIKTSSEVS